MIEFVILCGVIFSLLCFVHSRFYPLRRSHPIDHHYDDWLSVAESSDDHRNDTSKRGVLSECFYCGSTVLTDGDNADFKADFRDKIPEIHCNDCATIATRFLCE